MGSTVFGKILGAAFFVALAILYLNRDKLPSRPVLRADGVLIPILTGTKWEGRGVNSNSRLLEIEFSHGDQRKDHKLNARVKSGGGWHEASGKYKDLHIELEVKLEKGVSKVDADINPNDTGEMYGSFTSKLGNLKFRAREDWSQQPR